MIGKVSNKRDEIIVKDYDIYKAIVDSLLKRGYKIYSEPIIEKGHLIGNRIKIYKEEEIYIEEN